MKNTVYLLTAVLVILSDQITKYIARDSIAHYETIRVLPFLQLVNVRNEGAAFGLFRGIGNVAFIIISVIAIVLVLVLLLRNREERLGLSLILGGAAGNLIDRIFFGSVTDFIDVFVGRFHWPAFNIADSALTIGLILMIYGSIFRSESKAA